jgi:beta-glucanase (GH16 family)
MSADARPLKDPRQFRSAANRPSRSFDRHAVRVSAVAAAQSAMLLFALVLGLVDSAEIMTGPIITSALAAETQSKGAVLNRTGLVPTFSDDFAKFSWYAEGLSNVPRGGGTWRTNFGYAGVQDLRSRTLSSNGEMQIYVDRGFRGAAAAPLGLDPFRATKGGLEVIADRAPDTIKPFIGNYQYTSGLITTLPSFSQLYGVFEMRARVPRGKGLWPAFWLLPTNHSWPPEIDVFEILGNDPTILHTNAHSKATGKHTDAPSVIHISDASADFHTYAVDWEPDDIAWYFDEAEVARKPTPPDMHTPMYILIDLAVGGHWPGSPDASVHFPATLAIQWLHVYQRKP